MALNTHNQCIELIERSHRPVIVLPAQSGPDGLGAAFALATAWAPKKTIDIVSADGTSASRMPYIKSPLKTHPSFGALRKFILNVDVRTAPLQEVSYDIQNGLLSIFLTPQKGTWSAQDVSTQTGAYKYDLIISLGATEREAFGALFRDHADFFYKTPIINIDHTAANEQFGQVNLVDLTATSVCEVVFALVKLAAEEAVTEDVATMLLGGMIGKTNSFRTSNITPQTLERAGELMKKGARRDEIVQCLFRTRSVETLRLWGRALARLKKDSQTKLVWSVLSRQDFVLAGAEEDDLPDVIEELIRNAPEARVAVLLYEDREHHVCGLISGGKVFDSLQLAIPFKPEGTRDLARICFTDRSLPQAEQAVIEKLKERIRSNS
ncbi:hypothetical protein HYV72_00775 [Candidatus Uhrbacteria bacterium]|nr:hypothetical protein [Candidatus Uhrbacteria bacterium]